MVLTVAAGIDVKNDFLRFFYILVTFFTFFNVFYFSNVFFLFLKKRWQSPEHLQEFEIQCVHK